jgi:hypothetical protein
MNDLTEANLNAVIAEIKDLTSKTNELMALMPTKVMYRPADLEAPKPRFIKMINGEPCITLIEHEFLMARQEEINLSRRSWAGLTEEEIHASKPPLSNDAVVWELAVEWAEAKLKEKST